MSHVEVQSLLQQCEDELLRCRDVLNEGNAPDMQHFQTIITQLCDFMTSLPREEAEFYAEHLQALNDALSAIETIMSAQKQAVQQNLNELENRKDAHTAYKNQPSDE